MLIERMRKEHKFNKIVLCYIEGNEVAKSMYESLGFNHTGAVDGDEVIMELYL